MDSIEKIASSFEQLSQRIVDTWQPHVPNDGTFYETHGWQQLPLTVEDASVQAYEIAQRLRNDIPKSVNLENETPWPSLARQADLLTYESFPNDPGGAARSTFDFLLYCSMQLPTRPADVNWAEIKSKPYVPRELARKIKSLEARLEDLMPRADALQSKIDVIETAHDAAERLPTDMAELRRSRDDVTVFHKSVQKHAALVENHFESIDSTLDDVRLKHQETLALVDKCNENYRITTSAGLAGAFETRSRSLNRTAWVWVGILAVALGVAIAIGAYRLEDMSVLMQSDGPISHIFLNFIITSLGIAGPVWLAWLATKNISQSFKLAEDYAFKASISKAYEGYRKEAVNLDMEFAKQLFGSALSRLDEVPSRLLADKEHNSPIEAMLDSPALKSLFENVPELREKIVQGILDQGNVVAAATGGAISNLNGATRSKQRQESRPGNSTDHDES